MDGDSITILGRNLRIGEIMSFTRSEAIKFLNKNGAGAASHEYSDAQILALLKMIDAKNRVGIAEDVKISTGSNPSFWVFLEEVNFTSECRYCYPELPESLARFCQKDCEGDIKIVIDTIENLVYDSIAAGFYGSERQFKILSSFMKDVRCVVNFNKDRQERTTKNINRREGEAKGKFFLRANSLYSKLKDQSNVIVYPKLMPSGVSLARDRDILNDSFCRLCHRPIESISPSLIKEAIEAKNWKSKHKDVPYEKRERSNHYCSGHYPENRTGRDLINKVFKMVVDSQSQNQLLRYNKYPHIDFSNNFPIFELSLKEPDLSLRSILLFKWANRLEYVVMLKKEIEKIVFAEGGADISDVWDDNHISNFRNIYILLAKEKCFPKFGDVKDFDFYVENNRMSEATEKFFGLNKDLNLLMCYTSVIRYLSYRMIEIVSKIKV